MERLTRKIKVIVETEARKPFLLLRGRWLKEVGSDIETDREVSVEDGRIVIEPAELVQKKMPLIGNSSEVQVL